jgi:hypothetical protein
MGGYGRIWAKNNRFHPVGYGASYVAGGGGWLEWQDMYLNDSTKVDNIGSVIEEPKAVTVKTLSAPVNLSAQIKTANHVVLGWTKGGVDGNGFRIERAVKGGRFIGLEIKDSSVTQYTDSGLDIGSYSYRIAAYSKDGISEYSNVASALVTSTRPVRGKRNLRLSSGFELLPCFAEKITKLSGQHHMLFNIDGSRVNNSTNSGAGVFLVRKNIDNAQVSGN